MNYLLIGIFIVFLLIFSSNIISNKLKYDSKQTRKKNNNNELKNTVVDEVYEYLKYLKNKNPDGDKTIEFEYLFQSLQLEDNELLGKEMYIDYLVSRIYKLLYFKNKINSGWDFDDKNLKLYEKTANVISITESEVFLYYIKFADELHQT